VHKLIEPLHHLGTAERVLAERAMNAKLQGGCQVPIAGHAIHDGGELYLRALVGTPDGTRLLRAEGRAPGSAAETLGEAVANDLLGSRRRGDPRRAARGMTALCELGGRGVLVTRPAAQALNCVV
jgi:porphobilinogen deaminase